MQALQLDVQRVPAVAVSEAQLNAAQPVLETLEYLTQLADNLWGSARDLQGAPTALLEGASHGAIRVRRARQAAALQNAVNVLTELVREQRLGSPFGSPTR